MTFFRNLKSGFHLEKMQHENGDDVDEKSDQEAEVVEPAEVGELVVQDAGGNHNKRGEKHVINWIDLDREN